MPKVGDLVRMRDCDGIFGIVVGVNIRRLTGTGAPMRVWVRWNDCQSVDAAERVDWLEILSEGTRK